MTSGAVVSEPKAASAFRGTTIREVPRRREFFPTTHSDLRVTWHPEADTLVLTLWADDGRCTGSAPLRATDAGRLLSFVARGLAERAAAPLRPAPHPTDVRGAARGLARAVRQRLTAR